MDRGARQATVHGVAKSQILLSDTHNTRNAVQSARLLRRQRFAMSPPRLPVGQCQTQLMDGCQMHGWNDAVAEGDLKVQLFSPST